MNKEIKAKRESVLAKVIKSQANLRGMTIGEVGEAVGRSPAAMSSLLYGNPNLQNLQEICNVVGITVCLKTKDSLIHLPFKRD